MATRGVFECERHFASKGNWISDVTYRVHMGLPISNRLMEPMELTADQRSGYSARPFEDLGEGYFFQKIYCRSPKHSKVDSKVPFMTVVRAFVMLRAVEVTLS